MKLSRRAAAAWRHLTWKHWAWATGIAAVVSLSVPFQYLDVNSYWAVRRVMLYTPWVIAFGYCFVFAIGWVEADAGPSGPSIARYFGAALLTGVFCIATAWTLAPFVEIPPKRITENGVDSAPANVDRDTNRRFIVALSPGLDAAFHGCLATLIYARLRKSRLAALALGEAELGRLKANRNLLAAKLEAANAAVDPAYVIDRLEAIGRGYEVDPAVADSQLDELILFLRGAIPRLRSDPAAQIEA